MQFKTKYTSSEIRQLMASGACRVGKGGRLIMDEPDHEQVASRPMLPDDCLDFNPLEYIFIPGTVFSSKNSKQIFKKRAVKSYWYYRGECVVPFITDSKAVKSYKKRKALVFSNGAGKFKEMVNGRTPPYFVELIFVMPDLRVWDFNNLSQIIQDMMVKHNWIKGDDVRYLFTIPPLPPIIPYYVDKTRPGVYIKLK